MTANLPTRVLSWYGDDFTGSTDALEAIAPYMPAVLFLRQPEERFFSQFSSYAAFGLAGTSRSESPDWMDTHLAGSFEWLRSLGAATCHYKVCSTFDSSPSVGNIGRAIEIGKRVFASAFVPIVVGAPSLRRYTAFGNLFAAVDGVAYRIDRHPTMKAHPVTPMKEGDLRLHLREQTSLAIELLDLLQQELPDVGERFRGLAAKSDAVLIDVINESSLRTAGCLLWTVDRQPFVVGSSGVEYSLIAFWNEEKLLSNQLRPVVADSTERILVLSGSCSPVTQQQIAYAGNNGFDLVRLDARALTDGERTESAVEEVHAAALAALERGRSVVMFTAASPQDRVDGFSSDASQQNFRQQLSERAGQILNRVVDASGVKRVVIAGGDTSSHAGRRLGVDALTFIAHLAPGAPLCRGWSERQDRQDLELVFKGGQCGKDDFFETVMAGDARGRN